MYRDIIFKQYVNMAHFSDAITNVAVQIIGFLTVISNNPSWGLKYILVSTRTLTNTNMSKVHETPTHVKFSVLSGP